MADLLRTHFDADAPKVTVEFMAADAKGDVRLHTDTDDGSMLFEAGVRLIEAAMWLTSALNRRSASRMEAVAQEMKQRGRDLAAEVGSVQPTEEGQ